jgi:hypothetical protein
MPENRRKESRPPIRTDDKEQSRLFIEKAREIGTDEDKSNSADDLIGRLARKKPEPHKKHGSGLLVSRLLSH